MRRTEVSRRKADLQKVTEQQDSSISVHEAEALYRAGKNAELLNLIPTDLHDLTLDDQIRLLVLAAMAKFDLGNVVDSIRLLREAVSGSEGSSPSVQFTAAFAHFLRESDFLEPTALIPHLTRLRQVASFVGDGYSLASLHLAVARVEGCRGHYVTAHHHLDMARSLATISKSVSLNCTVDVIDASLEALAGNLTRSKKLAGACLERAVSAGFVKYEAAALSNLAVVSVSTGHLATAHELLSVVLPKTFALTYVRLGALDTLAQLNLREGNLSACLRTIKACQEVAADDKLPARSWYDLAHQITRCAYFEQIQDWDTVIRIANEAEPELARRQYKAVRTSLLGAKARALARLGRHDEAARTLAAAVRACPRGAVDPLIVLEASRALCAALKGDASNGRLHYDRALDACRAIGHRYHEWWIAGQRDDVLRTTVAVAPPAPLDTTHVSRLLGDVTTALGAGHSIDLLAHRVAAILQATPMKSRVEIHNESGHEYRAEPSAEIETATDGACTIRLMGSDRLASITVRGADSIEEMSLVKSVTDLVQMAVARTADTEREDEDFTLWPRAAATTPDAALFRSPRMIELVRIAERLADTVLPVLITGETGTGKEVVARLIHEHSPQKRGPFVPFNCSAVARDLVESQLFGHRRGAFTGAVDAFPGMVRSAERGTLFLDEIGDLDPVVQPKLLRFLESGEIQPVGEVRPHRVAVRIVAATNSQLDAAVAEGRFRSDLFYRLGVAKIELPPLRERKDEIPAFASYFLARFAAECGRTGLRLADDLIAALLLYDWPGNIRQLANEIRRIVAMAADGQTLSAADLAPDITANWHRRPTVPAASAAPAVVVRLDQPLAKAIDELERQFVEHALAASQGRIADAAQLLGLSRKGLFLKRRRWGLIGGES